jgi:lysophospholipase L1-like esterase
MMPAPTAPPPSSSPPWSAGPFDPQGKITDPQPPARPLTAYAAAMQTVALEKHVHLIDLQTASRQLMEKLGPLESAKFANKTGDSTHFNEAGARAMATLIMKEFLTAVPQLKPFLKPTP